MRVGPGLPDADLLRGQRTPQRQAFYQGHTDPVDHLCLHPAGDVIATIDQKEVHVWSSLALSPLARFAAPTDGVIAVCFCRYPRTAPTRTNTEPLFACTEVRAATQDESNQFLAIS